MRAEHAVRALPAVARAALIFSGALPWLVPWARGHLDLGEIGVALDALFLPMCHRVPERSLAISGVLMPLCSRCAGIFAGIALGALIARPRLGMRAWKLCLAAAAALMLLEVLTQDMGIHPVFHPTRIATGVLLGYAMAAAFVMNTFRLADGAPPAPVEPPKPGSAPRA